MSNNLHKSMGYVPALDGLRAVAIILVLLTHANFQLGANGIIGVDIFFALSGFLITTLLLQERSQTNKISIRSFYIRRAFRLYPALLLLLGFIVLYALLFQADATRVSVLLEAASAGLYLYNISWLWGWGNGGLHLLSHTWTLAVEEQFYLVWPWIVLLFLHRNLRNLTIGLVVAIVGIFILKVTGSMSLIGISIIHEAIFIGCLAAILRWEGKFEFKIPDYVTFLLLAMIVVIGVFPMAWYMELKEMGGRSVFAVVSVLIILSLTDKPLGLTSRILSHRILVWIGKISYSLYLWHVPIFKLFKLHSPFAPAISFVLKFVATFIVAQVSWMIIERRATQFGRKLSGVTTKPVE